MIVHRKSSGAHLGGLRLSEIVFEQIGQFQVFICGNAGFNFLQKTSAHSQFMQQTREDSNAIWLQTYPCLFKQL